MCILELGFRTCLVARRTTVTIRDNDNDWKHLNREVKEFNNLVTDVGFFDGKNAEKMLYNEYGTQNIPARGVNRRTAVNKRKEVHEKSEQAFMNVVKGGYARKELAAIGGWYGMNLSIAIEKWNRPKNAASTISGKGFNNPLVDTGEMKNSVTHKERES